MEKTYLSIVVDGANVNGLVDITEFEEKNITTTETKNSKLYTKYSGEGNSFEMTLKVKNNSELYFIMESLREISNFYPVINITSDIVKTLSVRQEIEKFCGNLGFSGMLISSIIESSNNFSREADVEEKITKSYKVFGRVLQKPDLLEI